MAIVTIWEHENFNGKPGDDDGFVWSTDQSVTAVPAWANDRMSSYRVKQGYRVEFYGDFQYQNLLFSVPPALWQAGALPDWGLNDKLTAIRIISPQGVALPERNAYDDEQWADNTGTNAADDHRGSPAPRPQKRPEK